MNGTVHPEKDVCRVTGREGVFVLASGSPRRGELLRGLLKEFVVIAADIDEESFPGERPEGYVLRISRRKAETVSFQYGLGQRDVWVLGADTIVVLGEKILGKPQDADQARRMLTGLQDRDHEVFTGVCLLNGTRGVCLQDAVRSRVWMRRLAPEEINAYVGSGEPFDKAGGYAIQGRAGRFVMRVDGSYSNVVGLPVERVQEMLRCAGIS